MNRLEELAAGQCRPRKGSGHRLDRQAVEADLSALPGWALAEDGQALSKRFGFADYYRTMAFVNALAWIAHVQDHHPDLEVGYNRVLVRYSTHDVGGISENDLICAAKAEQLAAGAPD
ncbi:MAG TPA: 4a-hydroxytetrahydrobiopterin dehydratase [Xanthomonadaceae bacterium]|nr:4a-hydroxytetrahydrobiopterin dehydratase [Xanthomonadaceae bacterium]